MTYEITHKDTPYKGRVFSVTQVEVVLPDQRSHVYDRINIQDAVTILPVDADMNLYFVRQFRIGSNSILLELPAGKIESGEGAQATAEREIREEIGMAAGKMTSLGGFYMSPGYSTEYMHCFLATELYTAPLDADMDEFLNIEKIPFEQVKSMIAAGNLPDSKSLAVIMLAWEHLNPPVHPK
jgi:ADP-ribose pyrophosphatase